MEKTPMSILNRPFSIEPLTGVMLPDGIFDTAIFEQQITAYYTNNSGSILNDVDIYFEGVSDLGITVSPKTFNFPIIPSGASVKVSWLGNFQNASPGKKNVSIIAKSNAMELKREIKQIFVTRTSYDSTTQLYSCEVPEGTLQMRIVDVMSDKKHCKNNKKSPSILLPVKLEMTMMPNPGYEGQFGDLPFQDPWWKIFAWIVFALATIGAFIAAYFGEGKASVGVEGEFDETTGTVSCCSPSDGLSVPERITVAGVLSTIASAAIVVGCADDKDPWRRGQEATPVKPGEITLSENVIIHLTYLEAPSAGKAYPVEIDWNYTRITNLTSYQFHVHEIRNNIHTLKELIVDAPVSLKAFNDQFIIRSQFIKENNKAFKGNELHVFALIVSSTKVSFIVPLLDDGIQYDKYANDGVYTGCLEWRTVYAKYKQEEKDDSGIYGYWNVFIYAQDTNNATTDMDPLEAATHIGGMMIASASELTFDDTLPCPLKANATVLVTP